MLLQAPKQVDPCNTGFITCFFLVLVFLRDGIDGREVTQRFFGNRSGTFSGIAKKHEFFFVKNISLTVAKNNAGATLVLQKFLTSKKN